MSNMKIPQHVYAELKAAIAATGGVPPNANERERWDALWRAVDAGLFDVTVVYSMPGNDDHIDTALRRIARED